MSEPVNKNPFSVLQCKPEAPPPGQFNTPKKSVLQEFLEKKIWILSRNMTLHKSVKKLENKSLSKLTKRGPRMFLRQFLRHKEAGKYLFTRIIHTECI